MEAQIDSLCSTNWPDVEHTTFLVAETKYVRENIKPELKEIRFEVMHVINLAQAVIWLVNFLNTLFNDALP